MKVFLLANPCAKNQQILLQWVICAFNKKAVSFCLKSHNSPVFWVLPLKLDDMMHMHMHMHAY